MLLQVDEHGEQLLRGEGTGLPLGIDNAVLTIITLMVFAAVWALWAATAKDFGGGYASDDGLSL